MHLSLEQLFNDQKSYLERLVELSGILIHSCEQRRQAGFAVMLQQMEELHQRALRLAEAGSPQKWYQIQSEFLAPLWKDAAQPSGTECRVSCESAALMARLVESQVNDFNHRINQVFNEYSQQSPHSNDHSIMAFKSLVAATFNIYNTAHLIFQRAAIGTSMGAPNPPKSSPAHAGSSNQWPPLTRSTEE